MGADSLDVKGRRSDGEEGAYGVEGQGSSLLVLLLLLQSVKPLVNGHDSFS